MGNPGDFCMSCRPCASATTPSIPIATVGKMAKGISQYSRDITASNGKFRTRSAKLRTYSISVLRLEPNATSDATGISATRNTGNRRLKIRRAKPLLDFRAFQS